MIGITGIDKIVDTKTIEATFSGDLLYLSARIKLNTAAGIEYCNIKIETILYGLELGPYGIGRIHIFD